MDTLSIHDLEVWTHIGVPEEERKTKQRLLISVAMELDASQTGKSDDVLQSINYDDAAKAIRKMAETERKTIEKFAEDIAAMILSDFQPISVTVEIQKFILTDAKAVSISMHRP